MSPIIEEITIDLLNDYVSKQNEKEDIRRTKALIKNKKTRNITSETATAINNEESINAPNMISLIDDRTNIAIERLIKTKAKANKKNPLKGRGAHNGSALKVLPKANVNTKKKKRDPSTTLTPS